MPWQQSLKLAERLHERATSRVTLVKDGDHRLSRDAISPGWRGCWTSFASGSELVLRR